MNEDAIPNPLAGLPGSEADVELFGSAEIQGGARVLEVAQLVFGELRSLRYLETPRWRLLRPRAVSLGEGREPLVRWRGGRFELLLPAEASGEIVGTRRVVVLEPGAEQRAVPVPSEGRVRLRIGEHEVRLAWVRPPRRMPRAQRVRKPRWGIATALGVSFLVHQAALAMVLSVPPSAIELSSDVFPGPVRHTRRREPVEGTLDKGRYRRGVYRATVVETLGPFGLPGDACQGETEPEVYIGHLQIRGARKEPAIRSTLERSLYLLRTCYRKALAGCAGPGRLVLELAIGQGGYTLASEESASFDSERGKELIKRCVREVADGWRFPALKGSTREATRVRVPIVFRYAGADRFYPALSD